MRARGRARWACGASRMVCSGESMYDRDQTECSLRLWNELQQYECMPDSMLQVMQLQGTL